METKIETPKLETLERLGFKTAVKQAKYLCDRKRKLALAYEHYRFVRQEKVDEFNRKLKEKSQGSSKTYDYQRLAFTPIESYEHIPPADVLTALEVAQDRKCFDSFEIAHIVDVKDPILFGRVEQCPDRFFIGQWDTDVSIDDLISRNEG